MHNYKRTKPILRTAFIFCCLSSCIQKQTFNAPELDNTHKFIIQEQVKYDSLNLEELLSAISRKAIELGDFQFDTLRENWIGSEGVLKSEIKKVESKLHVKLPTDYKAFIKITNGFPAVNQIEPSFLPISKIDYTSKLDPLLISIWGLNGVQPDKELAAKLERSIIIGGLGEEQLFMLIPPKQGDLSWEYWKFANWIPGEEVYVSLRAYFETSLDFCESMIVEK